MPLEYPNILGPVSGLTVAPDGNDRCPAFPPDFQIFYFDSERNGGYGDKDLWWVYSENIRTGKARLWTG